MVSLRLSAAEALELDARRRQAGLSRAAYLRAAALGTPGPRAKRRAAVDVEVLAAVALQLRRLGGTLRQMVSTPDGPAGEDAPATPWAAVLTEIHGLLIRIEAAFGDHQK